MLLVLKCPIKFPAVCKGYPCAARAPTKLLQILQQTCARVVCHVVQPIFSRDVTRSILGCQSVGVTSVHRTAALANSFASCSKHNNNNNKEGQVSRDVLQ